MSDFLDTLRSRLPAAAVCTDPERLAPRLADPLGRLHGRAQALLLPASAAEAAIAVRLCAVHGVPIVPQAGNTGLVGGQTPDAGGRAVLLGCDRLNRIRAVDAVGHALVAEAGCTLVALREAAEQAGRLFPLWLASAGSAMLGGLVGSNAGGTQVLRYGTMRELVLGIEAVLPDGEIYEGLHSLRKRNVGYDLKQLFIGGEGTLGFVTAASLRLWPRPRGQACALVALADAQAATALFARAQDGAGDVLTAFELINRAALELVMRQHPELASPFGTAPAWTVLIELAGSEDDAVLQQRLFDLLAAAADAAVAQDLAQRARFWALREHIPSAQKRAGPAIKHDLSLPIAALPGFLAEAERRLATALPDAQPIVFGHVGDGNLHYNLQLPAAAAAQLAACEQAANATLYTLARGYGGDFSAEHGIGRLRLAAAEQYHDPVERRLMQRIKSALDPADLFNPGAMLRRAGR
ncbi:FAD-binding oxidoreductase [Chitinimonas koreensis]|uniref:FAD-binding oxidoreductase n=1 Tax=Chitinimonas koreensis TaxID=356302 RepID=UPI00048BC408|nr:FAD-binding oxidoreductase [Chitinimonas koreensis]QNM95677.1 FAD-binding oxidoreductase [Chitinimonas koreensis]